MKTKQCGVFAALAAVLLLSAALVTGCVDPIGLGDFMVPQDKQTADFQPPAGNTGSQLPAGTTGSQSPAGNTVSQPAAGITDSPPLEKKGYIYLNLSTKNNGARTIMPNTGAIGDIDDFDSFSVYVVKADSSVVAGGTHEDKALDYFDDPIEVVPGNYTVQVFGNYGGGAVAFGEDDTVQVIASSGGSANIVLKEIVDGKDDGTFAWDIAQAPTTPADTVTMIINGISSGATPTTTVSEFPTSLSGGSYTDLTGISLKSGYYRVEIEQEKTGHKTVKTLSILHIYQGFTSTFDSYTLPDLKPNVYSIAFDLGTSGGTLASVPVNHGAKVTKPTPNPTFVPDGEQKGKFENWYTNSGLTTLYDFDQLVINAFTLYAKWTPVYEVIFDYNDGRGAPTDYDTKYVDHGQTVTAPTTNPTHTGGNNVGRFAGWYTTAGGTTAFNFSTAITADTTVYAKWTPVHAVTFDYNDEVTDPTSVYHTEYVVDGETVTAPTTDPEYRGTTLLNPDFIGWYTDAEDGGDVADVAFVWTTPITEPITLYAKWGTLTEEDLQVNITFVGFTNVIDPVLTATVDVGHKTGVEITVTLENPGDYSTFVWSIDGFEADATTVDNPELVLDVTDIQNKLVGTYIIYVEGYQDGKPVSGEIRVHVTYEP